MRQEASSTGLKQDTVLVYPKHGKEAVTLIRSDIDRLEPGEMLNDSIIDFWLRYATCTNFLKKYEILYFCPIFLFCYW
jgi:Ulp1 family protease